MGTGPEATALLMLTGFGIVVAILWIILPFAVLGIKPLLRELIAVQRRTNELLEKSARESAEDS